MPVVNLSYVIADEIEEVLKAGAEAGELRCVRVDQEDKNVHFSILDADGSELYRVTVEAK